MFRNKKYTSLVVIAALTASNQEAMAVRVKSDSQWHLAMVPDSFGGDSDFMMSRPPTHFGFADPFGDNFGSFGGFGGFDDFPRMPSFGSEMGDMMRRAQEGGAMNKNGQSYSSSSSSSYSSSMGEDGKRHEKSSRSGEKTVCKDGKCKVLKCNNGHCKEKTESAEDAAKESRAEMNSGEMRDSFADIGRSMRQMEQGFMNMERNMANQFRDLPRRMHEMADQGGETQSQSYSSSFQSGMGQDGKMHQKESK